MPSMPHSITPIESYMPSEDGRSITQSFILDGENFMYDSKGPKSWFGHCPLLPYAMDNSGNVQSLRIQDRDFVFTGDAILTWRAAAPTGWELLYQFSSALPSGFDPWTGLYLNDTLFFFHPSRGTLAAEFIGNPDQIYLRPQTTSTIPGLLEDVRAATIVHGRAIIVNTDSIQWSNTGSMSDLTPALGGAGFQEIAEYVQGEYLGLTSFQDGFVVWTTGGPLAAEFIGGDLVWSWYPLRNRHRPINDHVMVENHDGHFIFLDVHGLQMSAGDGNIQDFSPNFNEFLKHYVKSDSGEFFNRQYWRLDYNPNTDFYFLSESADNATYWRTFVYAPAIQKWGIMTHQHIGFARWTPDTYGFLDPNGIPMYFTEAEFSFTDPSNALGYDRYEPLTQKRMTTPSTTSRSRSYQPSLGLPLPPFMIIEPGWYLAGGTATQSGDLKSFDSYIEIGYVRPAEMMGIVSDLVEFQEMFVSNLPALPDFPVDFRSRHKKALLYPEVIDWDSETTYTPGDYSEDYNLVADVTEDWVLLNDYPEDWLYFDYADIDYDVDSSEDWNDDGPSEDWGGLGSGLNPKPYTLQWLASMDGITFDLVEPRMARFDIAGQLYTGISSGAFHRIRLEADEPLGFYHASAMKVTIHYGGKLL